MEKSSARFSAGMTAEEQDFIMSVYRKITEKISKVNLIAFKQNEIGNRFWQSLGWKYCDNVNYYEYVLNEENITVFNP